MTQTSKEKLATCDPRLIAVFTEVEKIIPIQVICGHRGEGEQEKAYRSGHSKVRFPNSKHNAMPSRAVDVAPAPLEWSDRDRFIYLAGIVRAVAHRMGVNIRFGGDWNENGVFKDEKFRDLVHFELID